MMHSTNKEIKRLLVIENKEEYLVVYEHDIDDWIATFDKSWEKAKQWAENMVDFYNREIL